jgi:hypothetical protein
LTNIAVAAATALAKEGLLRVAGDLLRTLARPLGGRVGEATAFLGADFDVAAAGRRRVVLELELAAACHTASRDSTVGDLRIIAGDLLLVHTLKAVLERAAACHASSWDSREGRL